MGGLSFADRLHGQNGLTTEDQALEHPVERSGLGKLSSSLGRLACTQPPGLIDPGLLNSGLFDSGVAASRLGRLLAPPAHELFDRIAADAKLDQIQTH